MYVDKMYIRLNFAWVGGARWHGNLQMVLYLRLSLYIYLSIFIGVCVCLCKGKTTLAVVGQWTWVVLVQCRCDLVHHTLDDICIVSSSHTTYSHAIKSTCIFTLCTYLLCIHPYMYITIICVYYYTDTYYMYVQV